MENDMLKLKVPDMTCGHCAAAVAKAVKEVDTNAAVNIDLPNKTVVVEGASEPVLIRKALEQAGYPTKTAWQSAGAHG
jgi:copper chaperone